jgi:glycosyltransferase involved in cell wall biosynthesis
MTGVERFAMMVLRALDEVPAAEALGRWKILAPQGVEKPAGLRNIEFETVGSHRGHLWEQSDLLRASRKGRLISLCNSGPIFHRRQLVVLHDAWVYRHPEHFSFSYGLFHRTLGRMISSWAKIATVSNFSKSELSEILRIRPDDISVIPNAADHTVSTQSDASVLKTFNLSPRGFFLFVGSPAPNKNLSRAIGAFMEIARADIDFVLVGAAAKSFADSALNELPPNVIRTGRLSDSQIKALYENALALVFPSTYEGFGIPPLEAMKAGCLTLAADIPAVREVCADAAVYFDPFDVQSIADIMLKAADDKIDRIAMIDAGHRRADSYSWLQSAEQLVSAAKSI